MVAFLLAWLSAAAPVGNGPDFTHHDRVKHGSTSPGEIPCVPVRFHSVTTPQTDCPHRSFLVSVYQRGGRIVDELEVVGIALHREHVAGGERSVSWPSATTAVPEFTCWAITSIVESPATTRGRCVSECGEMGVMMKADTPDSTDRPAR